MSTPYSSTDGRTVSIWQNEQTAPSYGPLTQDAQTQVCVIGAGIAGLTSAYLLLKEGKKVVVLDDSPVGDGQTGRTSAHLASALDDRFYEVTRMHGQDACRRAYQSHAVAIDTIERIAADEQIDCDFVRLDGYLFLAPGQKEKLLDDEFDAARRVGAAVEKVDHPTLRGFNTGPALQFPRQGRFHPQKYLSGLCRAIDRLGGKIYTATHVNDAQGADPKKNAPCKVTTDQHKVVIADHVVVATNTPAPINDWAGIYTKQASYRTYVIGCHIPRGAVTDALYWDMLDPYHYVRLAPGDGEHDVLIVGGEDHKTGHTPIDPPFDALERWTRERFPQAGAVTDRWSGQVQEPADGLAYIGVAPTAGENVLVITGDSGMGLTHGTLGAILVRDLILGRDNPWTDVYNPRRKPTAAPGEYLKENLDAASTLREYITPGEAASEDQIAAGEGALVRHGLKKLAVYKDNAGACHRLSSVCPHLGCIVHWNSIEKSWDCPCHGSRFTATGGVVMGPSIDGLSPAD